MKAKSKYSSVLAGNCALIALCAALPAVAQDAGSTTLQTITVDGNGKTQDPKAPVKGYVAKTSASATKTGRSLIETPQSITVITRDQMDNQSVRNLSEALNYVQVLSLSRPVPTRGSMRLEFAVLQETSCSSSTAFVSCVLQVHLLTRCMVWSVSRSFVGLHRFFMDRVTPAVSSISSANVPPSSALEKSAHKSAVTTITSRCSTLVARSLTATLLPIG